MNALKPYIKPALTVIAVIVLLRLIVPRLAFVPDNVKRLLV